MSDFGDEIRTLIRNDFVRLIVKISYTAYVGLFILLLALLTIGFGNKEVAKYIAPSTRVVMIAVIVPYMLVYLGSLVGFAVTTIMQRRHRIYYFLIAIFSLVSLTPIYGLQFASENLKRFAYDCEVYDLGFWDPPKSLLGLSQSTKCATNNEKGAAP